MLDIIFRSVFSLLFAVLCWLVFIPIAFILATPVLLIVAFCGRNGTFKANLLAAYRNLWISWKEWGVLLTPPW
jgi:hypothetical protein